MPVGEDPSVTCAVVLVKEASTCASSTSAASSKTITRHPSWRTRLCRRGVGQAKVRRRLQIVRGRSYNEPRLLTWLAQRGLGIR